MTEQTLTSAGRAARIDELKTLIKAEEAARAQTWDSFKGQSKESLLAAFSQRVRIHALTTGDGMGAIKIALVDAIRPPRQLTQWEQELRDLRAA